MFAVTPGKMLDHHPVLHTGHATRPIVKVRGYSPQRHKLPAPLGQAIIARCRPPALGATPAPSRMRLQLDFDPICLAFAGAHPHFLVNESHKSLYLVEDGLNL